MAQPLSTSKQALKKKNSPEDKQTKDAQRRLGRLNAEISNLESAMDVNYRPEKPEFYKILSEAEDLAAKVIAVPEKPKKPFGADDPPLDDN